MGTKIPTYMVVSSRFHDKADWETRLGVIDCKALEREAPVPVGKDLCYV